jgi:hypothetical protein
MKDKENQMFHPSYGLGGYREQVTEAIIIPMFRNSDPVTSKKAAKGASKRSPSQQTILLKAYRGGRGLTDEEAGVVTGLALKPKCCYWKRCSELRTMGFIVPTGDFARSSANELQMICKMTTKGEEHLNSLEA